MARAIVQIAQSYKGPAFDRVAELLYHFKTMILRESDSPDDIDNFLAICAEDVAENLHRSDAQTAKLIFNLTGKVPSETPAYGINLWAVHNPIEQHNWLEFDLHLMLIELAQVLAGHERELPPYARLAMHVVDSFIARAPMRIPQGNCVAPASKGVPDIDWSVFFRLPHNLLGAATAITALAFLELVAGGSGNLRTILSLSSLTPTRNKILKQFPYEGTSPAIAHFMRNYSRNSVRLFSA